MPRLSLGLNQRNFNGSRATSAAAVNMGSMRGKGSTSRMFNYCTQHSKNPSECINQFINLPQVTTEPPEPLPPCDHTFSGAGNLTQSAVNDYFNGGGTAQNICIVGYTGIDANAFIGRDITSVTIGDSVTTIGAYSFQSCQNLSTVILGTSVTGFSVQTFYQCTSLKNLKIPPSVTGSYNNAFLGSGLTTITIANGQVISGIRYDSPNQSSRVPFFGASVYTKLP